MEPLKHPGLSKIERRSVPQNRSGLLQEGREGSGSKCEFSGIKSLCAIVLECFRCRVAVLEMTALPSASLPCFLEAAAALSAAPGSLSTVLWI